MKVHKFYVVNVPDTVNVATLQPPAGAGNVVTVFVPGLADIPALAGPLIIMTPEPPAPLAAGFIPPPPPEPVLTVPDVAAPDGFDDPLPPPPDPPAAPVF